MIILSSSFFPSFILIQNLFFIVVVQSQQKQFAPTRPKSQQFNPPQQQAQKFMSAPQCRCKDLDECAAEIQKLVEKCKTEPKCEAHLKKIGNVQKIRQCLADEQKQMEKLEQCVEKKVGGPIGCTNDLHPKNLTVPIIPEMEMMDNRRKRSLLLSENPGKFSGCSPTLPELRNKRGTLPPLPATQEAGHAPPELSDFLMCVDQCAVKAASPNSAPKLCATREGNMNCAFKLKCALAPPDDRQQKAFDDCEQQMQFTPPKRLKKSCECLKAAGVKIVCPK
ncbi:unnamed protein product [Meloidogyne enterolobii]|uniref:Uncharacterized protein n=1 Tax=Meloidogyne enterolobii TaxID=390850 RepID=A0ACB0XUJ0_MELEN